MSSGSDFRFGEAAEGGGCAEPEEGVHGGEAGGDEVEGGFDDEPFHDDVGDVCCGGSVCRWVRREEGDMGMYLV